jgi:biotin carboxyl carrier protein
MIETNIQNQVFTIEGEDGSYQINDISKSVSRRQIAPGHYIYNIGNRSIDVRVISNEDKTFSVSLDGQIIDVPYRTSLDLMLEKMGLKDLLASGNKEFKAPMPGLVLKILVSPGDQVKKGTPLLVLEAMKMENNIKADAEAVVESIEVKEGQSVEKNQILIKFQ